MGDNVEFVIAKVEPGKLNALVKNLMRQMNITDPNEAVRRINSGEWIVSQSVRRWRVLKCDIKKFFDSINQDILLRILSDYIPDKEIINLLREIMISFKVRSNKGLPLGNLTSQLFVNIYMNVFD